MKILQIKETILYCQDLEKTREFYSTVLDLPVITFVEGQHVFFRSGNNVLLCFNPEASKIKTTPPPHYATGPQHIAFEVKANEYKDWKDRIRSHDLEIIDEITWKNDLLSFYFKDPDDHVLEILQEGVWD
jgi:catechol 2,3-dioxygenase-like lactoylglutathione lyase family enzyme